jgi:myosin heavy subunit
LARPSSKNQDMIIPLSRPFHRGILGRQVVALHLLLTALVLALNVSFVRAAGRLSDARSTKPEGLIRATVPGEQQQTPNWTTLLRGGETIPIRRNQNYSHALEDQIASMDQQLRQSLQELSNLKVQLDRRETNLSKYQKGSKPPGGHHRSGGKLVNKDEATLLKEQVILLQNRIQSIQNKKSDFETLLVQKRRYIESLQEQLGEQQAKTQKVKERYQRELDCLQQELESKTQRQWNDLQGEMKERISRSAATAHEAVVSTLDAEVQRAARRVQKETLEQLEQERQRSAQAVGKQRAKMRALAKALAIREKKLHALEQQREQDQKEERKRQKEQALEDQLEREKQELLTQIEEAELIQTQLEWEQQQSELAVAAVEVQAEDVIQDELAPPPPPPPAQTTQTAAGDASQPPPSPLPKSFPTKAQLAAMTKSQVSGLASVTELYKGRLADLAASAESKAKARWTDLAASAEARTKPHLQAIQSKYLGSPETRKQKQTTSHEEDEIKKEIKVHNVECWQRRVMWQPMTLPPSSVIKVSSTEQR